MPGSVGSAQPWAGCEPLFLGRTLYCAKSNVLVEAEWDVGGRAMTAKVSGKDQEHLRGRVSGAAAV